MLNIQKLIDSLGYLPGMRCPCPLICYYQILLRFCDNIKVTSKTDIISPSTSINIEPVISRLSLILELIINFQYFFIYLFISFIFFFFVLFSLPFMYSVCSFVPFNFVS